MSEFEFVAILLSIIFGLGIANVLSGTLKAFFLGELSDVRLAWTLVVGLTLLINWWALFSWNDHENWSFGVYIYLTAFATVHYVLAVSLYPYEFVGELSEERRHRFFLGALQFVIFVDIGEAYIRDRLFEPWYYLPFMLLLSLMLLASLVYQRVMVLRVVGWTMFVMICGWAFSVRESLPT